ncbi:TIGR04283 family arsenosugar biosynthesis glycosyltransferase [Campylobacter curvus]|uniref:TIGR04283 family arsenosugar biosynthesis glycosyltransferase n=1 Tax=Campylobacter curvus TaxID=200 RepID=UPI000372DB0E|nr:TIGR04283 family arsenosugar biosynthesis glycosyltransferase [Campylobacter curvus]QKF62131.1 glycosyltransferase, family 2 [Campylobacter curvus]UEB50418.1 TIGR04283 family arsenosugar biosynthesis glycosyltransferase [Campylobacter curvus]
MAISVVIPIYNESPAVLENIVRELKKQRGEFEAIFVDGGVSEDRDLGGFAMLASPKGRGAQQNLGARVAKFEKILFLHADSKFKSESALLAAEAALEKCQIGCFEMKFDEGGVWLNLIATCANLRVKFRNIAFGDQGIFVRKDFFTQLGGFEQIPIMEDFELSLRLKKVGVKFHQISEQITTSARKFKKEGTLRTLMKMQKFQYKFRRALSVYGAKGAQKAADEIAKDY